MSRQDHIGTILCQIKFSIIFFTSCNQQLLPAEASFGHRSFSEGGGEGGQQQATSNLS